MIESDVNVLDLAYAERQLIVVRRDDVVAAGRTSAQAANGPAAPRQSILRSALPIVAGAVVPFAGPIVTAVALGTAVGGALGSTRAGSGNAGGGNAGGGDQVRGVLPIRATEAAPLRLPLGHPLYDVVYAGHPARQEVYYPLADFHRRAFEHKFTEALRLVTSLGAASIKVSALQGWGREFSANLRVGLPTSNSVGASASSTSSHRREFLYEAELDGSKRPTVPADLAWYPHEDSWQEVARQRLEHGLRSFELHVTYQDDFAITAELAASVEKVGLKAGGHFERQQSTVWAVSGTFPR